MSPLLCFLRKANIGAHLQAKMLQTPRHC